MFPCCLAHFCRLKDIRSGKKTKNEKQNVEFSQQIWKNMKKKCTSSLLRAKSYRLQTRHAQRPDPHLAVEARAAHPPLLVVAAAAAAAVYTACPGPLLVDRQGRRRDRPDGGAVAVDHGDAGVTPAVRGAAPGPHRLVRGPADDQPAGRARDGEHGLAVAPEGPDRGHVAGAVLALPHQDAAVVAARVQRLAPAPDGQGVHRRRVAGQRGDQVVDGLLLAARGGAGAGTGRPHADAPVGGARVHGAVGRHGHGVHGVVVRRQRLQAPQRRRRPHLERLVPGHGEEEAPVGGRRHARHGVGVLDPEPPVVPADGDVVGRDGEPAEAVGDRGERRGEADPARRARGHPPQAQAPVLVPRHGRAAAAGEARHALDRARARARARGGVGGGGRLQRRQVVERHARRPRDDEAGQGAPRRRDDGGARRGARGQREERGDVDERRGEASARR
jgi:hypothetical protein